MSKLESDIDEKAQLKPHRPNITIDTKAVAENEALFSTALADMARGSITPATLKSRDFIQQKTDEVVGTTTHSAKAAFTDLRQRNDQFRELLENAEKHLKNLADNTVNSNEFTKPLSDIADLGKRFAPKLDLLSSYIPALYQCADFIKKNDLLVFYQELYQNASSAVARFGFNSASMLPAQAMELIKIYNPAVEKKGSVKSGGSNKSNKDTPSPLLHPLETILILLAIESLNGKDNVPVLVDIFERLDNGTISVEDNKPKLHTIVLYKQVDKVKGINQILVIDPSNSDFSRHLAAFPINLFAQDKQNIQMVSPAQLSKIYAPANKDNVGPKPDQYRDCIDIAVKIALGLNQHKGSIDINAVVSLPIIQEITNQPKEYAALFFDSTEAIARVRQASDDNIRQSANHLVAILHKQIKSIDAYLGLEVKKQFLKKDAALLATMYPASNYGLIISKLFQLFQENNTEFHDQMKAIETGLQGQIQQYLELE